MSVLTGSLLKIYICFLGMLGPAIVQFIIIDTNTYKTSKNGSNKLSFQINYD